MTKVTTVKLKNIQDKDQLYVVIQNGTDKCIINVGQKTFDQVNKILEGETIQLDTKKTSKLEK